MKNKYLNLLSFFILLSAISNAQYPVSYEQSFENHTFNNGNDTLDITIESSVNNVWQIGSPEKNTAFDSAFTLPNAMVSDTINPYPTNNISRFGFKFCANNNFGWGILAIRWTQKIDFDKGADGGIIEYSLDKGNTWTNVFNNPYVYNYYGYNLESVDIISGEYAFSGTDTAWRDIWLCFDRSYIANQLSNNSTDTMQVRFTLKSDGINNNKMGWMMDNFFIDNTIAHTLKEIEHTKYLNVYPTVTNDILHIELQKNKDYHIIESIELINLEGQVIETWGVSPVKFYISVAKYSPGMYYLRVKSNLKTEVSSFIIQ